MKTIKRSETKLAREIQLTREFIEFLRPFAKYKKLTQIKNHMRPLRNKFSKSVCIPIETEFYFYFSGYGNNKIVIKKFGKVISEDSVERENLKGEKVTLNFKHRYHEEVYFYLKKYTESVVEIIADIEESLLHGENRLKHLKLEVSNYVTRNIIDSFTNTIDNFNQSQGGILDGDLEAYKKEYVEELRKVINEIEKY